MFTRAVEKKVTELQHWIQPPAVLVSAQLSLLEVTSRRQTVKTSDKNSHIFQATLSPCRKRVLKIRPSQITDIKLAPTYSCCCFCKHFACLSFSTQEIKEGQLFPDLNGKFPSAKNIGKLINMSVNVHVKLQGFRAQILSANFLLLLKVLCIDLERF